MVVGILVSFWDSLFSGAMLNFGRVPPEQTNMTMENPPFEDVFPIEHEIFQFL